MPIIFRFADFRVSSGVVRGIGPPILGIIQPRGCAIGGVTKDPSGVAVGGVTVDLYLTSTKTKVDSVVSDAQGNYAFRNVVSPATAYYCVAYKAGAPDVFGTTLNTLQGV